MRREELPEEMQRRDIRPGMVVLYVDINYYMYICKVIHCEGMFFLYQCQANRQRWLVEDLCNLLHGRLLQDTFYTLPEDIASKFILANNLAIASLEVPLERRSI